MLTADEVLVGTYVALGKQHDLDFLLHGLVSKNARQRITAHNWRMAEDYGESFLATWGRFIDSLPFPLLPPFDELQVENLKLLREMTEARDPQGGSGPMKTPSVFKEEPVRGDGYSVPVNEHGHVDLTVVQDSFLALQRDVERLTQQMQRMRGGDRGRGRDGRGGGGGRGDWRGYSRRRGPRGGEDDAAEAPAQAATKNF
jgi:hypothetical protein